MDRGTLLRNSCPQRCNDAIKEMTEGTSLLLASPREVLLPFQDKLFAINHNIRSLLSDINLSGSRRDSIASQGHQEGPVGILTSWRDEGVREPPTRPQELLKDVLVSAASHFESYKAELSILQHQSFDSFTQDPRIMHLYPIMILQRRRNARFINLRDRLLLVCSCMSLADDFHHFEKNHGWSSKQTILIADFLNDCVPAVQRIGKHLRSFLATMDTHMIDERRLDAGIRLGTKLNVAEAIGNRYGLGSSLTLVLGFEISRLSRLPFQALTALKSITPSTEGSDSVLWSSQNFGPWWSKFRRSYAMKFANPGFTHSDESLGNILEREDGSNVPHSRSEAPPDTAAPPFTSFPAPAAAPVENWDWNTCTTAGIPQSSSDNLDMFLPSTCPSDRSGAWEDLESLFLS